MLVVMGAVAPGAGNPTGPTGSVLFTVSGANPATYTANLGGPHGTNLKDQTSTASVTVSGLAVGQHTTGLNYNDGGTDPNFGKYDNANAATFTVSKAATSVNLSASPATPSFGQSVTFTATVSANSPGAGTLTGSVDFFDTTTNTDLGRVALSGGRASLTTTALAVAGRGPHAHGVVLVRNGRVVPVRAAVLDREPHAAAP